MEKIGEKQPNGMYVIDTLEDVANVFQQAKEMEKEQIMKAHGNKTSRTIEQGCDVYVTKTGEQYYNETYNK